jgi:3',5'-cyclic AMP phosphodiesterase CpdA
MKLYSDTDIQAIADAIRIKNGSSNTYTVAQMAAAIEALGDLSELGINPSYFLAETADTINKLAQLRSANTLFIAWITDSHIYTSSNNQQYFDAQAAAMNAVCKAVPPNLVVHGGDMTNGSEAKATTLALSNHVVKSMREIGGDNTLILIGNHDGNTVQSDSSTNETRRITESEMKSLYHSWDDGFTYAGDNYQGGQFYGYRDYQSLGLRVIRLHSYIENIGVDGYYGGQGGNWGYYADEVTWFKNVALNTDNDILILCHQTLSPILQGYTEAQDIPHRGTQIQQAIDNWLAAKSSHKCVGVLHGHVHWDFVSPGKGNFTVIDHNSKSQISRTGSYGEFFELGTGLSNYLPTASGSNDTPTSSYRDVPIGAIVPGRAMGTATQALWTAVIINTSTKIINLIRFGAGNDVEINYGTGTNTSIHVTGITLNAVSGTLTEGGTVALVATVLPSDATNKSVTWESSNTSVATVNGGVVTAISAGSATITAKTQDGDYIATYALTVEAKPRINQIPLSIDAGGNPYNGGTGYKSGYRLNSAGAEAALAGKYVTGFIPITQGQKVTLENIRANTAAQDNNYIAFYDANKTLITGCSRYVYAWYNQSGNAIKPATVDSNSYLTSFTATGSPGGSFNLDLTNAAYFRLAANYIGEDSAIYVE